MTVGVLLIASGVAFPTGGSQSASLWLIETFPQFGQVGCEVLYQLASGRSTDTALPEPSRSSLRVTRDEARGAGPASPFLELHDPGVTQIRSVRDRLNSFAQEAPTPTSSALRSFRATPPREPIVPQMPMFGALTDPEGDCLLRARPGT